MAPATKQATISLEADLMSEIEALASDRQRAFDDVIADALRHYITELKRDAGRQGVLELLDELRSTRSALTMDDEDVYRLVYDELHVMRDNLPHQ
jgi:metal-responsive CopG/Arc/MetJ family transcriptional regulator